MSLPPDLLFISDELLKLIHRMHTVLEFLVSFRIVDPAQDTHGFPLGLLIRLELSIVNLPGVAMEQE